MAGISAVALTAGLALSAGPGWHDDSLGNDVALLVSGQIGARWAQVSGPLAVSVLFLAQGAEVRQESNDEEFPGSWTVAYVAGEAALQLDVSDFAVRAAAGEGFRHNGDGGGNDPGLAYSLAASFRVWKALRVQLDAIRWQTFTNSPRGTGTTIVAGGIGVSF